MGGKEPAEMTVAVLREELKRRGLDTTGLKAVLVERLRGAIDAEATEAQTLETKASPQSTFSRRLPEECRSR